MDNTSVSPIPTDPETPADPNATRTEREIAEAQQKLQELLAKKAEEDAIKASVTPAIRTLAIQLHTTLCPSSHPLACVWSIEGESPDDPNLADWTGEQHARWLAIAQTGVGLQRTAGWTVIEPGA
jgi:hypothetical protein